MYGRLLLYQPTVPRQRMVVLRILKSQKQGYISDYQEAEQDKIHVLLGL
jgi:hypothetical protein